MGSFEKGLARRKGHKVVATVTHRLYNLLKLAETRVGESGGISKLASGQREP
jgi:hypothetical protein